MFFIIRTNFKSAIQITKGDNNDILLRFRKDVSFLTKPLLKKTFMRIPPNSYLLIDARKCEFMDPDIIEIIHIMAKQVLNELMKLQSQDT